MYPTFTQFPFNMYQPQSQAMQQSSPVSLIKVSGLDGAKAYQMPPNSSAPLFHESENILYVKSTDGAGFPTIRSFRFEEIPVAESVSASTPAYITREEFEAFKKELQDAKQSF